MPEADAARAVREALAARDYLGAETLARAALQRVADPASDEAAGLRVSLARALAMTGRRDEADAMLRAEADAATADGRRIVVADALDRCGYAAEALALYRRMLDGGTRNPEVLRRIGNVLVRLGRPAEAEPLIREALDRGAARPEAEGRLAPYLAPDGAVAAGNLIDRVLERGGLQEQNRISLSLALLAQGRWAEAWPYYEGRAVTTESRDEMPYPYWRGDLVPGRALIFRSEQGVGDIVMFARFAVLLGGLGVPVMLMAPPRLKALLKTMPGIAEVLRPGERVTGVDAVWAPLASLLAFFRLTPETVPPMQPYLAADLVRVGRWRATLPSGEFRVGIAWQGRPGKAVDIGRSVALAEFAPLAEMPGVRLIALQKGFGSEQIGTCGFGERIHVPGPDFDDGPDAFLDTAAMMMLLDLVVTSDTSVAHLAGALGRPCFLALKKYPEWRWGMAGETTPWYPSMRLFRQDRDGDWGGVFEGIAEAVRERAGAPRA